jgi:putative oxidoreductase
MAKNIEQAKLDYGLLVIRLFFVGMIFHGLMKLMNVPGTTGFFAHLGIPFPGLMAIVEPLVEVFGGFLIVLGFDTMVSGVLLAICMLVAIITTVIPIAASKGPLFGINGLTAILGLEAAYGFSALGLALTGPGKYRLSFMRGKAKG